MSESSLSARHLSGDWLALLSAVFYALFLTSIKTARAAYPASMVMIMVCIVGGVLLMLLAIYKHEIVVPLSYHGWIILFFVAFNGQVLGQTLLAYSVKYIPLQLTSIFLLLSPIFAAVYAYIIFHETLQAMQIIGIAVILAAVYYGKQILENSLHKNDF
jgi:drug/metabolite transporter (DMT)-like permease